MRGRHALVAVVTLQAVEDEVVQLAHVGLHVARGQAGVGAGQQRAQVQLEAAFDDGAGQAQRVAAQGERVLVAGRLQACGETAGQGVHALGDRQHLAQRRQCDVITTEARLVGLVNGQRHFRRFATGHGVVAAGDALQLREFVDHARLQVVLRQLRGTLGQHRVGTDLRRDHFGQRRDARHLVGHAAQLGLVGHRLQAVAHRFQALLQVFVEEELGIGEARADHALVTLGHFGHVLRLDVGDADEFLGQLAAVIQHREELLVDLHRLDQRFLRHGQERTLEAAQHRRRPLDQVHHLLQVVFGDAGAATGLTSSGLDLGNDALAALGRIDQHLGRAQRFDVILRLAQPHGLVMVEAVATAHAVGLQAEQLGLDHVGTVQQHQPVRRARKAPVVVAPAHRLGDRHRGDGLAQDLRQQRGGARTRAHRTVDEALTLVVAGFLQRGPVDPGLGGEALQGLGRLAFGVQCDVQVRAQHFTALFRLFQADARQQHGQAARGRQRACIAQFQLDAALAQAVDNAIEESLGQARQRLDRQLLGAKFDQQGGQLAHRFNPVVGAQRATRPAPRGNGVMKSSGAVRPSSRPGSPASRAARSRPWPPPGPAHARAGCSAGVRSR